MEIKKNLLFSPGYLDMKTNMYHPFSAGMSLLLCIQVFHCYYFTQ